MIFAFFTACVISTATGSVECTNSYTDMTAVIRKGESCELVAAKLQENAINSVLIVKPKLVSAFVRSGCGSRDAMRREAENSHNAYVANGIKSQLFEF
jgi:predicted transcriptional regulator